MVVAFAGSLIGSVEPYLIKTIQLSEVKEKAPAEASATLPPAPTAIEAAAEYQQN
jgi:hypothetical protein